MAIVKFEDVQTSVVKFAESTGIADIKSFTQNAYLLAQEESTQQFQFADVLKCLLKADKYGVSLVKKEAYMYPVSVKDGNSYVKKPLFVVDYKYEWQQILNNGDCEQFNVIEVFESDHMSRSLIGDVWEWGGELDGDVIGYYAYYKGKSGLEIGKFMTKEQILAKLPANNRNSNYQEEASKSEWLYMKGVMRQIKKKIPNVAKLVDLEFAENDFEDSDNVVNKKAAKNVKAIEPTVLTPPQDDDTPY